MKKKEFPIWFKIETMLFIFFSGAIGISYLKMSKELVGIDTQYLLMKILILMGCIFLVWLISLVNCCYKK